MATSNGAISHVKWCKPSREQYQLLDIWVCSSHKDRSITFAMNTQHLVSTWMVHVHIYGLEFFKVRMTFSYGSVIHNHLLVTSWNIVKSITDNTLSHSKKPYIISHLEPIRFPLQQDVIVSSWGHFALCMTTGYKLLTQLRSLNSR